MIRRSHGFTLVELLLATAIMSIAFTVLASGILDLYHRYQAGLAIRTTQQNVRLVANQLTQDVRSSAFVTANPITVYSNGHTIPAEAVCLFSSISSAFPTGVMYYVSTNAQGVNRVIRQPFTSVNEVNKIAWGNDASCDPSLISNLTGWQTLTASNVSAVQFVDTSRRTSSVPKIDLSLASTYDVSDVNTASPPTCTGVDIQFCSVTSLQIAAMTAGAQ